MTFVVDVEGQALMCYLVELWANLQFSATKGNRHVTTALGTLYNAICKKTVAV